MRALSIFPAIVFLVAAIPISATPSPVRVTGDTTASGELLKDTLDLLTQYAPLHDCDRISTVDTRFLPQDKIPRFASYRVKSNDAAYERWTVNFCGKFVKFMIVYTADPAGGTFISVNYPYPRDAL